MTTTALHPPTNAQVERYKKTLAPRLRLCIAYNQQDWDVFVQSSTYSYSFQEHCLINEPLFSLTPSRHRPGPATAVSPSSLRDVAAYAKNPKFIHQKILHQVVGMQGKVLHVLTNQQGKYKRHFYNNVRSLSTLTVKRQAYVSRTALSLIAEEKKNWTRYNKILLRATGPFTVMDVESRFIIIDKDGVPNTISTD